MSNQTPSNRRFEKTRQGILDAARKIVLDEGHQALSIRRLAEMVDYSPAAIYRYYSSRDEILDILRQEAWQKMAAHEPASPTNSMTMGEAFIEAGRNYLDFATQNPQYYQLIINSAGGGPNSLEEFKKDPNFVGLLEFVEAAVAAGEFELPEGYTPFHLALLSWFIVHAISMLQVTMMSQCTEEFKAASLEVIHMVKDTFERKQ